MPTILPLKVLYIYMERLFPVGSDYKEDRDHCFRHDSYNELNVKVPAQSTCEPGMRLCTQFIVRQAASATDVALHGHEALALVIRHAAAAFWCVCHIRLSDTLCSSELQSSNSQETQLPCCRTICLEQSTTTSPKR